MSKKADKKQQQKADLESKKTNNKMMIKTQENLPSQVYPHRVVKKKFPVVKCIAVIVVGFVVFQFGDRYLVYRDMQTEVQQYTQVLAEKEQKQVALQEEQALLNDDAYLERLIRSNLGLVKNGETLIFPVEKANVVDYATYSNEADAIH